MEGVRAQADSRVERLSWDEICARFPNEWVVLVDIDWIDQDCDFEFRSAVVLDHSIARGECLRRARGRRIPGSEFAHLYTGPVVAAYKLSK